MKKLTTEEFIKKAREIHGDKYDYSKSSYINSRKKIIITCPIHGDFVQKAHDHLNGHGCPFCGGTKKLTTEDFIKQAKERHGDKYDYSKSEYVDAKTKVCIICKEHGEFWQMPLMHIRGYGCPKCSFRFLTTETFIEEARKVHGDKYDYSKVNYIGMHKKVCIICPEHGEFWQTPGKHLVGQGCKQCSVKKRSEKLLFTYEDFIRKSHDIHGDKYDYSKVKYVDVKTKVCIICPKHGEFWQVPLYHLNGHGCPKCGILISNGENKICEYLSMYFGENGIIKNDRKILNGKEIDILIPSKKIGIEYDGLKWHSEEFGKGKNYHLDKTLECKKHGIKLIHVFEDEYIKHKEIVLSKLSHILGISNNLPKIYGRKCLIKDVSRDNSIEFLNKYHIQGYGKCTFSIGCYYDNMLIGVMSFLKHQDNNWELVRFATDYNYICCGVGGKLFKYFIDNNEVVSVKTFADRRWTINDENLYTKLGFKVDKILKPDYRYIDSTSPNDRMHKFSFRKRSLHKKYNIPLSMTETEMCKQLGFKKIWDCGLIKYVWKK